MGKPARGNACASWSEHIASGGEPGELKHLSTRRKREDSLSSGERKGRSPNSVASHWGLEGGAEALRRRSGTVWEGRPETVRAR